MTRAGRTQKVAINVRSFKDSVVKLAADEMGAIEAGRKEATASKITRIERAGSEVTRVKDRVAKVNFREPRIFRTGTDEKGVHQVRLLDVGIPPLIFDFLAIAGSEHRVLDDDYVVDHAFA
jgi:hypothetical protein